MTVIFAGIRIYTAIFGIVAFLAVISLGMEAVAIVGSSLVIMVGGIWR